MKESRPGHLTRLSGMSKTCLTTFEGRDTTGSRHGGDMRTLLPVVDTKLPVKGRAGVCRTIHLNYPDDINSRLEKGDTICLSYSSRRNNFNHSSISSVDNFSSPPACNEARPDALSSSENFSDEMAPACAARAAP